MLTGKTLVLLLLAYPALAAATEGAGCPEPCQGNILSVLAPCPKPCPDNYTMTCGHPCDNEGDRCGNRYGDARTCVNGRYECEVHPPLNPGCNWLCNPYPGEPPRR
jgi:hypothetical protein